IPTSRFVSTLTRLARDELAGMVTKQALTYLDDLLRPVRTLSARLWLAELKKGWAILTSSRRPYRFLRKTSC
ncbi:MAG: hypothetical protein ACRDTF_10495, partial [Pseudonocardiaceae bacterium]